MEYLFGRVIYYNTQSGQVIYESGDIRTNNSEFEETRDDYANIKVLAGYVRENISEVKLEYGQCREDFTNGILDFVDPVTKQLFFIYPDPNSPEPEAPVHVKPLSEQVKVLESQNNELMLAVAELASVSETDKMETQLAIAELASTITGGVA